jgi:peptide/nickel transport system substrate-binding protein
MKAKNQNYEMIQMQNDVCEKALASRRQFLKTTVGLGAFIATTGVTTALSPVFGQSPKRGGTLAAAMIGSPSIVDPHTCVSAEDIALVRSIYDSLVFTDHTLTPRPELAESWEVSSDAKVWTFHLRKGVRFHHGRELDADDVVWSYKRILAPETASPARKTFSVIESIQKLDKITVRFNLSGPFSEFVNLVGGSFQGRIGPRDVSNLNQNPSGTGPFKLTEFVPGDHSTLVRNDAYWRDGQPYLDTVRYVYFPEMATHVAGLLQGSIDISWSPTAEVLPIFKTSKDIVVRSMPTNWYQPIVMAVDNPPFDDNRVRQAFKYLVDRPAMNDLVLGGYGALGNDHPIPPNSPMYMEQTVRKQNIEKAKALLSEAGYKNGLDLEMMTWTGRAGLVNAALAFQDMAKKADVRIKVITVPSDVFLSKYWLKYPFFNTNWNARTTLYELLSMAYYSDAKWNESHWKSEKLDALLDRIRSETDDAKRKEIYAEVQKMFIDEGSVIIPYHRPRITAHRKHVEGFQPHPTGWMDLRTAWLS